MKKILKVFIHDLKNIIKNPAALFIIIGLCVLPSLYAWVNIKACWDPYANTGNLPVAVVNKDEGANFKGEFINVGEEVEKSLKENKKIGWVFTEDWQGNNGLNEGKYYALIEIPSNFTKGLTSLESNAPMKPNIIYKANEKANAIATKITNAAKESVAREIKANFIDTVNKEAFEKLNTVGIKLEDNKSKLLDLNNLLKGSINQIGEIKNYISKANSHSKNFKDYMDKLQNEVPKLTDKINTFQDTVTSSKEIVNLTKGSVNSLDENINSDLVHLETINTQIKDTVDSMKKLNTSVSNSTEIIKNATSINNLLKMMDNIVDSRIKILESLNDIKSSNGILDFINSLKKLKVSIKNAKNVIGSISSSKNLKDEDKNKVNDLLDKLGDLSYEITDDINQSSNKVYSVIRPTLNNMGDGLNLALTNIDRVLEDVKFIIPKLNMLSKFGKVTSGVAINEGNRINERLTSFENDLVKLTDKTKILTEENLNDIIDVVKRNPESIASFISSPIKITEEEVYNVGTFGIGLTPFYTVLAIWIGALLSCALLTVECEESFKERYHIKSYHEHFGKMLLFLTISIIQSLIITLGDIYLLKVNPVDPKLMLQITVILAVVFTIIIYTLVSLFGNVGKAIAVIIMVFQVAGAGGIYPIQTNPEIFGRLQFLWPFTYGINAFREAIAGPIWQSVHENLKALYMFGGGFFMLIIIKKPFHKLSSKMDKKFRESGL